MVEGIEILSQSEVGCGVAVHWTPVIVVTIIATIALFATIIIFIDPIDYKDWFSIIVLTSMCSMFIFLVTTLIAVIVAKPKTYETHYKVTISDEVSMNEFLEQYEIVDQEGKIYTIKDKEN